MLTIDQLQQATEAEGSKAAPGALGVCNHVWPAAVAHLPAVAAVCSCVPALQLRYLPLLRRPRRGVQGASPVWGRPWWAWLRGVARHS